MNCAMQSATIQTGGFSYGGTLISNGDIGYQGNAVPRNMMGNNHGGMVCVNGQWYIFYHRQTHGTECSRQGCAEENHHWSRWENPAGGDD